MNFKRSPLPLEKMKALLPMAKKQYQEASPFPHIVFDDFFHPEVTERLLSEFPGKNDINWINFKDNKQVKFANEDEANMSPFTRYVLHSLNSSMFLEFLEELVGIPDLLSDPSFIGGGMHNIFRTGKLGIHIDFNKHPKYGLYRRLNLLLYLNKDWKEEFGGHIEFWDPSVKKCVKRISPIFNRMVIFTTTATSFHGHPDPLNCPPERSRKSLALYYYTVKQEKRKAPHSTVFRNRPGEKEDSPNKIKKYFSSLLKL
ncbi:MAG: 2OG-Fe(II) oxygenase [Nitrospinota bacterium]